ncbi:MAG: hypothetical protein HYR85_00970 [Planctomycetes bacterium]|nr:hypothetical protein [Planctomycetota bacterium]MBI3844806.1 hypothetical protein [Planctomycetota bacterium]
MNWNRIGAFVVVAAGLGTPAWAGELDPLGRMIGNWVTKGTWDDPSKGGIRVENEWALDGRMVKGQSYLITEKGEQLVYESVFAWHPGKKKIAFQSYSTWGDFYDGVCETKGDGLELTWTGFAADKATEYRETLAFPSADSYVWTVFEKKNDKWAEIKKSTFERAGHADAGAGKAAFERIKTLAGTWHGKAGEGDGNQDAVVEYKISAANNVVMETLFPGSNHEMISMYYLVGDELVMTHYCAMGNQPHMRFDARASKPDTLVFAFDGGTNFDPKKDAHIHCGQIRFVGSDRIESRWNHWGGGSDQGSMGFSMTRKER